MFKVCHVPSHELALSNCLIFHEEDVPEVQHVHVEQKFWVSVKKDNCVARGRVGVPAALRKYLMLDTEQSIEITPVDTTIQPIVIEATVEVGFLSRNNLATTIDGNQLGQFFITCHTSLMLSVRAPLLLDFQGTLLLLKVLNLNTVKHTVNFEEAKKINTNFGVVHPSTTIIWQQMSGTALILQGTMNGHVMPIIQPDFKFEELGIGGLDVEFQKIFRRAFASRIFPPDYIARLGIAHVKGVLLYGPPGTGKTLIARQIGKMLNACEPKIVSGPEVLNKYVGASEENVRKLFADAEKDYQTKGDQSQLHVIIFDELDAICRQRGSKTEGAGVGDSVVNQLLAKIDGVNGLNNILLIGMTNRKDLIDEALMRPGRLEVHVEICLPDQAGRCQIFRIHTAKMHENQLMDDDVRLEELAQLTKNYSGAEIEGCVKSATSFAFSRHVRGNTIAAVDHTTLVDFCVTRSDFLHALDEVKPVFGYSEAEFERYTSNGIISFSPDVDVILQAARVGAMQITNSVRTPKVALLLHGLKGSGKTALATRMAINTTFPFVKLITPENFIGMSETTKTAAITKAFDNSYKSSSSAIVIDDLERLLDYTPVGPRFSNSVLQTLLVLLNKNPPQGHKLLIIATTSCLDVMQQLEVSDMFQQRLHVPAVCSTSNFEVVLKEIQLFPTDCLQQVVVNLHAVPTCIGVKHLLSLAEMVRQETDVTLRSRKFLDCLQNCSLEKKNLIDQTIPKQHRQTGACMSTKQ